MRREKDDIAIAIMLNKIEGIKEREIGQRRGGRIAPMDI